MILRIQLLEKEAPSNEGQDTSTSILPIASSSFNPLVETVPTIPTDKVATEVPLPPSSTPHTLVNSRVNSNVRGESSGLFWFLTSTSKGKVDNTTPHLLDLFICMILYFVIYKYI